MCADAAKPTTSGVRPARLVLRKSLDKSTELDRSLKTSNVVFCTIAVGYNNNEFTVKKNNNLKSWQSGVSGNPKGRPKGSRNIKKVIQDLLNDKNMAARLSLRMPGGTETSLEAIVYTLMVKAIKGDVRAAEVLLKHSIDKDMLAVEGGFFSQSELKITVVGADGKPSATSDPVIGDASGTIS
jgi:hypothetical protein